MNILMLGAGVQSSCLLEMSARGELPAYDLALFADTGNEPRAVYEQVSRLEDIATHAGIELRIVRRAGAGIVSDALAGGFSTMPLYVLHRGKRTILRRQCTANYKIAPCDAEMRLWLMERGLASVNARAQIRVNRGVIVNKHLGISSDERRRVSAPRVGWQKHEYPLIKAGMTRVDCEHWYTDKGLQPPPKSSCIVCPYHDDEYWRTMPHAEFLEACAFDDALRSPEFQAKIKIRGALYLHRSCRPLRDIDFTRAPAVKQLSMFDHELINGACKSSAFSCFS